MARPRKATVDPFTDLQKKAAILEREMERQRAAMERLKQPTVQELHSTHGPPSKLDQRLSR
jgi:predicted phosphohydrolase